MKTKMKCISSGSALFAQIKTAVRPGCFAFIVVRMSCDCKCSVGLPHSVVGWSAVCGCGIFIHTHLLQRQNYIMI